MVDRARVGGRLGVRARGKWCAAGLAALPPAAGRRLGLRERRLRHKSLRVPPSSFLPAPASFCSALLSPPFWVPSSSPGRSPAAGVGGAGRGRAPEYADERVTDSSAFQCPSETRALLPQLLTRDSRLPQTPTAGLARGCAHRLRAAAAPASARGPRARRRAAPRPGVDGGRRAPCPLLGVTRAPRPPCPTRRATCTRRPARWRYILARRTAHRHWQRRAARSWRAPRRAPRSALTRARRPSPRKQPPASAARCSTRPTLPPPQASRLTW